MDMFTRAGRSETGQGDAVTAALSFIVEQPGITPYFESAALTGGLPREHFETRARLVPVHDLRDLESSALDRTGFELRRHATAVEDLYDEARVQTSYREEVARLLLEATGADDVVVFDHTRRSDADTGARNVDGARRPASRVHVDYTARSGPQRARDVLGEERFERVLSAGGRVAQVNVWRPIVGPVQRSPLALADARSVDPRELVRTEQLFPERVGEIYHLAYSPHQRWYWAPAMERDEVLLIKGWDSEGDGRARFTPHAAFHPPDEDPEAPPRESIEVRAFLVFEGARDGQTGAAGC